MAADRVLEGSFADVCGKTSRSAASWSATFAAVVSVVVVRSAPPGLDLALELLPDPQPETSRATPRSTAPTVGKFISVSGKC
jgi:hypothetical protein